jgi:hypothetical protein
MAIASCFINQRGHYSENILVLGKQFSGNPTYRELVSEAQSQPPNESTVGLAMNLLETGL